LTEVKMEVKEEPLSLPLLDREPTSPGRLQERQLCKNPVRCRKRVGETAVSLGEA
jgi:hypothetical protein